MASPERARRARAAGHDRPRLALGVSCLLGAALVAVIYLRYPGDPTSWTRYLGMAGAAFASLAALGTWLTLGTGRLREDDVAFGEDLGVRLGALGGILWAAEIAFNNLVSPEVSTASARGLVDNGVWAAVSVLIAVAAGHRAYASRRWVPGLWAGLRAGLLSGLIACLAGLLLICFGMDLLARDPLALREFADRAQDGGAPDLASYLAYETLAGALGHLFVLGIGAGAVLGALGAGLGRATRALEGRPG